MQMQEGISLNYFRSVNIMRAVELFKTWKNVPVTYWTTALAGEVGELCNMIKKLERVRLGGIDAGSTYTAADITPEMIREEIGGIFIYLDLLAALFDVDLGEAAVKTFNDKSAQFDAPQFVIPTQNDGE